MGLVNCELCKCSVSRDFELVGKEACLDLKSDLIRTLDTWDTTFKNDHFEFLEHTSANPVGKPHLGNLVNSLMGDLVHRTTGVIPSFYVNDLGKNFAKVLTSFRKSKGPLNDLYARAHQLQDSEVDSVRKRLSETGLEADQIELRNKFLKIIIRQLRKLNVASEFKFYYESDYLKEFNQHEFCVDPSIRLRTSSGIPLYMCYDLFYRRRVLSSLEPGRGLKLMITGRDHSKYNEDLKNLFEEEFSLPYDIKHVYYPTVVSSGRRLSKRKNVTESLNLRTYSNQIRLFVWKNLSRDSVDFTELRDPKILNQMRKISKLPNASLEDPKSLVLRLDELQLRELELWTRLKTLLHKLLTNLDLHRIYKLLEFVYLKSKRLKNETWALHEHFRRNLLLKLGFK